MRNFKLTTDQVMEIITALTIYGIIEQAQALKVFTNFAPDRNLTALFGISAEGEWAIGAEEVGKDTYHSYLSSQDYQKLPKEMGEIVIPILKESIEVK